MGTAFVSFKQSDRDWAHWLAHEIEALGHVARVHEWDIGGGDFMFWMARELDRADIVLCVASNEYFASKYCEMELTTAIRSSRRDFCRIVVVRDCKIPGLYSGLSHRLLFRLSEADARRRLADFVKDMPASDASEERRAMPVPYPGRIPGNITLTEPIHFKGREETLADLADALRLYPGRVSAVALCGMPGAGKSMVAATYAARNRDRYRIAWWIRAAAEATIEEDLVALGVALGWVTPEEADAFPTGAVLDRLSRQGRDVLLVFDNANDSSVLSKYLPTGGEAHVIITSNTANWGAHVPAKLDILLWPPHVGAEFLVVRIPAPNERQKAAEVSEELEGLPLALEMAASYCEELGLSLETYLRIYENVLHSLNYGLPHGYPRSVKVAFDLALEEAGKRNPAARTLIEYCALLAPDPIPLSLFARSGDTLDESLRASVAGPGLNNAIAALRSFGLLLERPQVPDERYPEILTDSIRLHRLVRLIVASGLPADVQARRRGDLIAALEAQYPEDDGKIDDSWPLARRLDPHAIEVLGDARRPVPPPPGREIVASRLMERLALFRNASTSSFELPESLLRRAFNLRTAHLPADHVEIVRALNALALLYWGQHRIDQALDLAERAIAMLARLGLADDPEMGWALVNLARIARDAGKLAVAREHCERSLDFYRHDPGRFKLQAAFAKSCLGRILIDERRFEDAMPFFDEALETYTEIYGRIHPAQAATLLNVSQVLVGQGKMEEARKIIEKAKTIYIASLGRDSAGLGHCLAVLAATHIAEGRPEEAHPLLVEALDISTRVLGPDSEVTRARRAQVASTAGKEAAPQ